MNKGELIETVATTANISKTDASNAVDAVISCITNNLKRGDSVTLVGFGTFKTSERKPRTGRNPRTGEAIQIPAATVPRFTAGKALKEAVN